MNDLVFNVTREEDGGYSAAAVEQLIFTQGDSWDDLRTNVAGAILAHYFQDLGNKPARVQLHLVYDEELLVVAPV